MNATLAREKANGAVGIKFEAAYLRPLDFDDPDVAAAQRTYAKYVRGGTPTRAEYKNLQDYLFRAIAREAGRQKLAIQIHVLETFGGFYSPRGSAPHLLEPAFNDSTLRGTKFIIVHGGWPLIGETQALMSKPNVYADISMLDDILSPTVLAGVLRQWLGEWPDKVLFGSDAFDGGAEQGWEQVAWVGSTTARRALAIALTGMLRDGEINRDRAQALARMVFAETRRHCMGSAVVRHTLAHASTFAPLLSGRARWNTTPGESCATVSKERSAAPTVLVIIVAVSAERSRAYLIGVVLIQGAQPHRAVERQRARDASIRSVALHSTLPSLPTSSTRPAAPNPTSVAPFASRCTDPMIGLITGPLGRYCHTMRAIMVCVSRLYSTARAGAGDPRK